MIGREQKRAGPARCVVACLSCGARNRVPAVASGLPQCARCRSWLPWVVEADDVTFDEVARRSPVPVVVDL